MQRDLRGEGTEFPLLAGKGDANFERAIVAHTISGGTKIYLSACFSMSPFSWMLPDRYPGVE
jgi:hypothetical protein